MGLDDVDQAVRRPGNLHSRTPALEAFSAENPKSPAYFVLAYHYLTAEFADAAVGQLKRLTAVEPRDALSGPQLLRQLEAAQQQVSGPELEEPKASTAKTPAARIAAEKPAPPTGGKSRESGCLSP